MTAVNAQLLAGAGIPQSNRRVFTFADDALAIAAEGKTRDAVCMTEQR